MTDAPHPPPSLPPLSQDDIDTCRAFGIPRLLMTAVREPNYSGGGRYWAARIRGDPSAAILFWGAEISPDHLWATLHRAYDPLTGDNEISAVDVRIVDLVTVSMTRMDPGDLTTRPPSEPPDPPIGENAMDRLARRMREAGP